MSSIAFMHNRWVAQNMESNITMAKGVDRVIIKLVKRLYDTVDVSLEVDDLRDMVRRDQGLAVEQQKVCLAFLETINNNLEEKKREFNNALMDGNFTFARRLLKEVPLLDFLPDGLLLPIEGKGLSKEESLSAVLFFEEILRVMQYGETLKEQFYVVLNFFSPVLRQAVKYGNERALLSAIDIVRDCFLPDDTEQVFTLIYFLESPEILTGAMARLPEDVVKRHLELYFYNFIRGLQNAPLVMAMLERVWVIDDEKFLLHVISLLDRLISGACSSMDEEVQGRYRKFYKDIAKVLVERMPPELLGRGRFSALYYVLKTDITLGLAIQLVSKMNSEDLVHFVDMRGQTFIHLAIKVSEYVFNVMRHRVPSSFLGVAAIDGTIALHLAPTRELVELMDAQDIAKVDGHDHTACYYAINDGGIEIAHTMYDKMLPDDRKKLYYEFGDDKVFRSIFDEVPDFDAPDEDRASQLYCALEEGDDIKAGLLIDRMHLKELMIVNERGQTFLHIAVEHLKKGLSRKIAGKLFVSAAECLVKENLDGYTSLGLALTKGPELYRAIAPFCGGVSIGVLALDTGDTVDVDADSVLVKKYRNLVHLFAESVPREHYERLGKTSLFAINSFESSWELGIAMVSATIEESLTEGERLHLLDIRDNIMQGLSLGVPRRVLRDFDHVIKDQYIKIFSKGVSEALHKLLPGKRCIFPLCVFPDDYIITRVFHGALAEVLCYEEGCYQLSFFDTGGAEFGLSYKAGGDLLMSLSIRAIAKDQLDKVVEFISAINMSWQDETSDFCASYMSDLGVDKEDSPVYRVVHTAPSRNIFQKQWLSTCTYSCLFRWMSTVCDSDKLMAKMQLRMLALETDQLKDIMISSLGRSFKGYSFRDLVVEEGKAIADLVDVVSITFRETLGG
jgi:hypothetical protein